MQVCRFKQHLQQNIISIPCLIFGPFVFLHTKPQVDSSSLTCFYCSAIRNDTCNSCWRFQASFPVISFDCLWLNFYVSNLRRATYIQQFAKANTLFEYTEFHCNQSIAVIGVNGEYISKNTQAHCLQKLSNDKFYRTNTLNDFENVYISRKKTHVMTSS